MRAVDVSVVITNYNYGNYIRRCIRSLLNQDLDRRCYEIIVVDDCSTDDSLVILDAFVKRGEIQLIVNEENLGVGASSRIGIDRSRAKYYIRVDADDYVQPQFLYMLSTFLHFRTQYVGVTCDYFITDGEERVHSVESFSEKGIACGMLLRTSYLESIGSYDPQKRVFEDKSLFERLDMERIYHLPVPLYNYVKHGQSLSDEYHHDGTHIIADMKHKKKAADS